MAIFSRHTLSIQADKTEDDSLVSKKEFLTRIDQARKDIAAGKGKEVKGKEELE